jgi:hypothetical protein
LLLFSQFFACSWSKLRPAGRRGGEEAGKASQYKLKERAPNLDLRSLKPLPEKREAGWGVRKPDNMSPHGADKPTSDRPFNAEADIEKSRAINERWRVIGKKMERYTQEQEDKINLEWFNRPTAWLKSRGFTCKEDFKPEKFTPERQQEMAIETAAMLEDIMEQTDRSLDDEHRIQRPDTPSEQDASGDSSSGSSR